ncbi:hypothetical protein TCAL_12553 [Tigriopus californicus]|uniref:Uncharacterized protein n=1 Tax=Tigriopus californicus TaxID=6832 RepID=A0A553PLT1_TIGCA|nr:hypothetical protein TCAL_12553 [Tigriopus californicus]|eukprot:TCALIF_12553-PA protein Name:"Protein of unknown function" AED:0.62 eAED:0.62 QI:0/0.33/0/0.5/1/1/4/0/141
MEVVACTWSAALGRTPDQDDNDDNDDDDTRRNKILPCNPLALVPRGFFESFPKAVIANGLPEKLYPIHRKDGESGRRSEFSRLLIPTTFRNVVGCVCIVNNNVPGGQFPTPLKTGLDHQTINEDPMNDEPKWNRYWANKWD